MEVVHRPFAVRTKADGAALRMAMRFHKLSYAELARRAGVSRAIVGHLASGYRTTCNPETAAKIAEALNLASSELFDLEALHVATTERHRRAA